jgi:hypothetical protein
VRFVKISNNAEVFDKNMDIINLALQVGRIKQLNNDKLIY